MHEGHVSSHTCIDCVRPRQHVHPEDADNPAEITLRTSSTTTLGEHAVNVSWPTFWFCNRDQELGDPFAQWRERFQEDPVVCRNKYWPMCEIFLHIEFHYLEFVTTLYLLLSGIPVRVVSMLVVVVACLI